MTSASGTGKRRGRPPAGGREAILRASLDLLRERGAARMTTREVAARAGVSEGSVFYHFADRTGLLTAVIEDGLAGLSRFHGAEFGRWSGDVEHVFADYLTSLDPFLDPVITVMVAAQSDDELRRGMAEFMTRNNFGPHRGVDALAAYLDGLQEKGAIRTDVATRVVAMLLIGSSFLRTAQEQMISDEYAELLPDHRSVVASLAVMLKPTVAEGCR